MTEHDKIEHTLPNGDTLVIDSTRENAAVEQAFSKARHDLREQARDTYRRLQQPVEPANA
jgi:hypothetical protein